MKELKGKKRGKGKVFITDEAIEHVRIVNFIGLSSDENTIINALNKKLLRIAKEENDSNEVAFCIRFRNDENTTETDIGIAFGDDHSVDPDADSDSYHIINGTYNCTVIVTHNHPSLSLISLEDIGFFIKKSAVGHFIAVTNLGAVSYLYKTEKFDINKCVQLYNECVDINNNANGNLKEIQRAAEYFLHKCFSCGVVYEY